jgi:hypothetical protein
MIINDEDNYINCDELIKEANLLYNQINKQNLYIDDYNYIISMHKYINSYEKFKERQIKQYINDLHNYLKISY